MTEVIGMLTKVINGNRICTGHGGKKVILSRGVVPCAKRVAKLLGA